MQNEARLSVEMMRELASAPGMALVLQERWKYSTWSAHKGRTGKQ